MSKSEHENKELQRAVDELQSGYLYHVGQLSHMTAKLEQVKHLEGIKEHQ